MSFFYFFFQAEDGIRDLTVTGVQTCALPILLRADAVALEALQVRCRGAVAGPAGEIQKGRAVRQRRGKDRFQVRRRQGRSEERRVGKECRSRWAQEN